MEKFILIVSINKPATLSFSGLMGVDGIHLIFMSDISSHNPMKLLMKIIYRMKIALPL